MIDLETLPCYTNLFLLQVMSILKYLYPVPREDSKRVLTFANHDDYISFRHHTHKKVLKYLIFLGELFESFNSATLPNLHLKSNIFRQKMAKMSNSRK